ncbi:hypothetical protein J6590_006847 [Homalodisca vitripennis]|nr:hypothetical protein J6590_006847 [Homalodisca vitripennis]
MDSEIIDLTQSKETPNKLQKMFSNPLPSLQHKHQQQQLHHHPSSSFGTVSILSFLTLSKIIENVWMIGFSSLDMWQQLVSRLTKLKEICTYYVAVPLFIFQNLSDVLTK